jgi:hypothetical protein
MNGCHSDKVPMNRKYDWVTSPQYKHVAWPYKFTRDCQYDQKSNDAGCRGCTHAERVSERQV